MEVTQRLLYSISGSDPGIIAIKALFGILVTANVLIVVTLLLLLIDYKCFNSKYRNKLVKVCKRNRYNNF
jgi:hypothetical protein